MAHANSLIKRIVIDGTTYDICDEAAHADLEILKTTVNDLSTTLPTVSSKATLALNNSLRFDENMLVKSGFSKVPNNNFHMNGTSGTNYYYLRVGRLVLVKFTVQCVAPTHHNFINVATGLPAPADFCSDMLFALGTEESSATRGIPLNSIAGSIRKNGNKGEVYLSGGAQNCYYYGQCLYFADVPH